MKNYGKLLAVASLAVVFAAQSCKKDSATETTPTPNPTPTYDVPASYNKFTNVDHVESTTILGMLTSIGVEFTKSTGVAGATVPVALQKTKVLNMFTNTANAFDTARFNTSGYQLQANLSAGGADQLLAFVDTLANVSNTGATAVDGKAGLAITAAKKRFLFTANGVNYAQAFNKLAMQVLIAYQITKRVNDQSLDNTAMVSGKNYTAMEHNWDVAFGYWAIPDSATANKVPKGKFWGSYSSQVDTGFLGCNKAILNAFLKGRAAITHKDLATKNAQAVIIQDWFERMTAGAVVQEVKEAFAAGTDVVQVASAMSEAKGFAYALKANKTKTHITDAEAQGLIDLFPADLWQITPQQITAIKTYISGKYNFSAYEQAHL